MDKFVRKGDVSYFGLESLRTSSLLEKNKEKDEKFNIKLNNFKQVLIKKINRFDPLKNKNLDKTDKLLQILWFNAIFNDITIEKQKELYLLADLI